MQSECLISGYSVAGRKYFRGTRPSQESCELAGKADFSGWIFDTVAPSGLFWRKRQMGKLMSKSDLVFLFEVGGNVRKGEHETKVYFIKQLQAKADSNGEETETRVVPMLREYTVFGVEQCENLPQSIARGKPMCVRNPDTRDELADQFLQSTQADIREGYGEAMYVPSRDFISMPAFEAFKGAVMTSVCPG
jgi:antirestriction protein ArdC